MKKLLLLLIACLLLSQVNAQNPITPEGVYFADPSAHLWNDGNLYLYGSLDESCDYYCSWRHHVLKTDDLLSWQVDEDCFASKGKADEVLYNDELLYAPDCAYKNDTFYLYYCQPDRISAEGVAYSLHPGGPFKDGKSMGVGKFQEIDPSVFIDDDGQAYYIWGQFSLKMAKLEPNMRELDLASLKTDVLTEKEHFFHEGAFLTKRKGIYYLVYADISRAGTPSCLGYATSGSVFGPYLYRGVIIDNNLCNPGNWNNHGSIAEFKNNWYVFYHRSTHGCNKMRKACIEPISFLPDGSIPEVEMTSQGAGGPVNAKSKIGAERACILKGNLRIHTFSEKNEVLGDINNGDKAVFKYIDFEKGVCSISLMINPGAKGGRIVISSDEACHEVLADINVFPGTGNNVWQLINSDVKNIEGVHALWFSFRGDGEELMSLDWFEFN